MKNLLMICGAASLGLVAPTGVSAQSPTVNDATEMQDDNMSMQNDNMSNDNTPMQNDNMSRNSNDMSARATQPADYPLCTKEIKDRCINPYAAGKKWGNKPLDYWPGKPASQM